MCESLIQEMEKRLVLPLHSSPKMEGNLKSRPRSLTAKVKKKVIRKEGCKLAKRIRHMKFCQRYDALFHLKNTTLKPHVLHFS